MKPIVFFLFAATLFVNPEAISMLKDCQKFGGFIAHLTGRQNFPELRKICLQYLNKIDKKLLVKLIEKLGKCF